MNTSSQGISEKSNPNMESINPRLIAFYLTQYHPIPENDDWWGKGFTEWTNVTKSTSLFEGHYQPHLPTDFGFYDLRLRETRHDQIRTAKKYGIDAFCYHYYWFSGTRLLNYPLDDMLADPESDMPFCLCWANENWTRRWDAAENEILIAQRYLPDDDLNFIKSLIPFFSDPRYIRHNGAPFLIVYRPQHLNNAKKTVQIWRDYCRTQGFPDIHICAALTHGNEDYKQFGFDSGVEFPPHNMNCDTVTNKINFYDAFRGNVMQYQEVAQSYIDRSYPESNIFRSVFPCWDNTARTNNRSLIILNGTPDNYEYWLSQTIKLANDSPEEEHLIFVNAWNEWAEGCHLEPDRKYQLQFLEATARAKQNKSELTKFKDCNLPCQSDISRQSVVQDLKRVWNYHFSIFLGKLAAWLKKHPKIRKLARYLLSVFK